MAERTKVGIYVAPSGVYANERLLMVDAILNEGHKATSDITEHPVETGVSVSDNMRPKPLELEMTCLVTNAPLDDTLVSETRAADAWEELEQVRLSRQTVTVVTGLKVYENMGILSLEAPRDSATGDCLRYTVAFKQIRVASLATVAAPVLAKKNRTPPPPPPKKPLVPASAVEESWLQSLLGQQAPGATEIEAVL